MPELRLLTDPQEAQIYGAFTYPYYRNLLHQVTPEQSPIALGISVQNKPVGLALASYGLHSETEQTEAWVWSIFIKKEYRQQGLGTALLQGLENILSDHGCIQVRLTYTENLQSFRFKNLLLKHNWDNPQKTAFLFYFTKEKFLQAPSGHFVERLDELKSKLSSEYELFPWIELTEHEEKVIRDRMAIDPLWRKFQPFYSQKVFEPCGSYGVRYRGEVVAWTIANQMQPGLLTWAQLFVSPDCPLRPRIMLPLTAQAIKDVFEAGWEQASYRVEANNVPMLKYVRSWVATYIDYERSVWTARKSFHPN